MGVASGRRARIGVLVPYTNTSLEPDCARLCPPGVSFHFTRIAGYELDRLPDADEMSRMGETGLDEALHLISAIRPDVVLYGCTSATLAHGLKFDAALADRIEAATGARAFTAAGAIIRSLRELGARNVALASPYVDEINIRTVRFLEEAGIRTVNYAGPERALSSLDQGALEPAQIAALARRADHAEAQAIVLACTDMRAVEARARIEAELGKPVVTSNLTLIRAALAMTTA